MRNAIAASSALVAALLVPGLTGCGHGHRASGCDDQSSCATSAVAALTATHGHQAHGVIRLTAQGAHALHLVGDVEGLRADAQHAFHIHEFGDLSAADGSSAGSHFDVGGHQHGAPDAPSHHAGDLGNIHADAQGKAHIDVVLTGVTLCGANAVIGRSLVVHEKADDLVSQPAGNAGARIAVGVIGIAKP